MDGAEIISFLNASFPTVLSTVGSITGGIITSIFLRHNTAATEFEKIKAGHFKEVVENLVESGKMTHTEYYKAKNFLQVAKKADEYYAETKHEAGKITYDFDWFIIFYEAVGNISDEEMQEIWARILAGEIAKPSSFSLKTIDTLKNISKKDADLFVKLCSHSFSNGNQSLFLPRYDDYLNKRNILYSDIMKLSEQGLIFNNGTISLNITINNESKILFNNNGLVMTIASIDESETNASILQYPFTEVGRELSSLIKQSASDLDFIEFGREINANNKDYKVTVHKVVNRHDNLVTYEKYDLLDIDLTEYELLKNNGQGEILH